MWYEWTAIPDGEVPAAVEPAWQHAVATYASDPSKLETTILIGLRAKSA